MLARLDNFFKIKGLGLFVLVGIALAVFNVGNYLFSQALGQMPTLGQWQASGYTRGPWQGTISGMMLFLPPLFVGIGMVLTSFRPILRGPESLKKLTIAAAVILVHVVVHGAIFFRLVWTIA